MAHKIKGKIADVSKWQGKIDWAKAAKELDFAIIRVQDNTIADVRLVENIQGAEANNVPYGVYAYYRAKTKAAAIEEADRFYDRAVAAGARPRIWYIDVEDKLAGWPTQRAAVTAYGNQLRERSAGRVGLYTFQSMYPHLEDVAHLLDDTWLARYGNKQTNLAGKPGKQPSYPCGLWQYTSCGSLAGVKGRVDLNFAVDKPLGWYTGLVYEDDDENVVEDDMPDYGRVKVTGLTAWVRNGPGKTAGKLGVVKRGKVLELSGESISDGWWQVEYKGGYGWISAKMAKEVG